MKTTALDIIVFVANSPLIGCGRGYSYAEITKTIKDSFGEVTPQDMRKKYPELEMFFQMSEAFLVEHPKKALSSESLALEDEILAKLRENNLTLVDKK